MAMMGATRPSCWRPARGAPATWSARPAVVLSPTYQAIAAHPRQGAIGSPALGPWPLRLVGPGLGGGSTGSPAAAVRSRGLQRDHPHRPARPGPRRAGDGGHRQPAARRRRRPDRRHHVDNYQIPLDFGDNVFGVVTTGFTIQKYRSPASRSTAPKARSRCSATTGRPRATSCGRTTSALEGLRQRRSGWSWTDGLRHLIDCVATGANPSMTPEHAYHVLDIMLTAMDAAKDNSYLRRREHVRDA